MNSCRLRRTRNEEYKNWSSFCSRCVQRSYDIVANSRKNTLEAWRRLQKRYDRTRGGKKRNLLRTIVSPGRCSLLELQAGIERWESVVSRDEKKLKNKMNDEIKLAGLEALVPEELEKHLILNSSRLRTFEDVRLEIGTYVEEKFGLKIRDSKPSDTGLLEHSDVGKVNSLVSRRKRVIQSAQWVFQVRWSTFSTRLQCKQERSQALVRQRQSKEVMVQE